MILHRSRQTEVFDIRIIEPIDIGSLDHLSRYGLDLCDVDFCPPAAGPEIELTVSGSLDERASQAAVEAAGFSVLAIRRHRS